MVYKLPYYLRIAYWLAIKQLKYRKLIIHTPPPPLSNNSITEVNKACTEQKIK